MGRPPAAAEAGTVSREQAEALATEVRAQLRHGLSSAPRAVLQACGCCGRVLSGPAASAADQYRAAFLLLGEHLALDCTSAPQALRLS
jgi:hypothetical protein